MTFLVGAFLWACLAGFGASYQDWSPTPRRNDAVRRIRKVYTRALFALLALLIGVRLTVLGAVAS